MRALPRRYSLFFLLVALAVASAHAQTPTVLGYWREPGGSIIRIAQCAQRLCVKIAKLPGGKRALTDLHNPDPKLRNRPLCGMWVGLGFIAIDPRHARDGHLYDPRSGRTYSSEMTADGNLLHLRGYVGLRIFGRTETWVRASPPPPC